MHKFLDLVHNAFKHSSPPSMWAKIEKGEKNNQYFVSCTEYPNTVEVIVGLQSARIENEYFGMLWYDRGIRYLLNRMRYTQEEIDAQNVHERELAEAKAKRMKK